MIRICLIGAGDIKYHYFELLKIPEEKFNTQLQEIAKVLAECDVELVLLPDKGICIELAKLYKQNNGKKVYGTIPVSDKDFGITHLEPYINAEIDGKKVIDETIDTQNWYKQDLTLCTFGDAVLMLGNSLGALGELVYGYYLYKLFIGAKKEVEVMKNKIHPAIRAGGVIPFTVLIYKPFIKDKLNYEIEAYIKKLGGKICYINNPEELKKALTQFTA